MRTVVPSSKVCHAVETGKLGAATLSTVLVELLLREYISAVLLNENSHG
jgi:hypothetical protein